MIRAGDAVLDKRSGHEWLVCAVHGDRIAIAGWPPGEVNVADVTLSRAATDEEHLKMAADLMRVRRVQPGDNGGYDPRRSYTHAHVPDCEVCCKGGLLVQLIEEASETERIAYAEHQHRLSYLQDLRAAWTRHGLPLPIPRLRAPGEAAGLPDDA